jgi:hypothetical protein
MNLIVFLLLTRMGRPTTRVTAAWPSVYGTRPLLDDVFHWTSHDPILNGTVRSSYISSSPNSTTFVVLASPRLTYPTAPAVTQLPPFISPGTYPGTRLLASLGSILSVNRCHHPQLANPKSSGFKDPFLSQQETSGVVTLGTLPCSLACIQTQHSSTPRLFLVPHQ